MSGGPPGRHPAVKWRPTGTNIEHSTSNLTCWQRRSVFEVQDRRPVVRSAVELAIVGGVRRVVKIEHEETLQVAVPVDPGSGPGGPGGVVVSGYNREIACGKTNPGTDRPGAEDRQGVHRPPEPDAGGRAFQTL